MEKDAYRHWTSLLSLLQAEDVLCGQLNKLELQLNQYTTCKADSGDIGKINIEMSELRSELEGIRKKISHRIEYPKTGGYYD